MVEYHTMSAKVLSRLHQFGSKVLPGIFLGYALHAGRICQGDALIADIEELEELEQMDASEIHARRLNANEVLTPMKGDNFIFPVADGTVKISGGDQHLRTPTLMRDLPDQGEEQEILQGESDGLSSPAPHQDDSTLDDAEAKNDFWSIGYRLLPSRGTQSQTVHAERRIISYSAETNRRYQKYSYITGCGAGEKMLMIYWNVDGDCELSDTWTRFTRFTLLKEKPPQKGFRGPVR